MWTYLSPKFDSCAQNLSSLATRRTSTLSIKRCWPLRLSAALAFSDSSGRMKFSVRVWLTTSSSLDGAGRPVAVLPQEELQDIDRDVCAHLDAADEVLSDDASGKRVVGEAIESVHLLSQVRPPRRSAPRRSPWSHRAGGQCGRPVPEPPLRCQRRGCS